MIRTLIARKTTKVLKNMTDPKSLNDLTNIVKEAFPMLDSIFIAKTITKIQKIADTLQKRQQAPYDSVQFRQNTERFYRKGYSLAQKIHCRFERVMSSPSHGNYNFYLIISDTIRYEV